jgi:hypothetical protein
MQVKALEQITPADMQWVKAHPNFSVLDTVEDKIAEMLEVNF